MVSKILSFIKRPTSFDIIVNTVGNYLNIFFTALYALILVRILNPSLYGTLSVLLGIAYVLANILDFGTTATIYSSVPLMYEKKSYRLYHFIKSTFFFQSLFSVIVIGFLLITFPFLDKVFFKTHAPLYELYLTTISVLFLIWQNFVQNIMYAAKKFVHANIYLNLANLAKTILLFVLLWLHIATVGWVIFIFGILGPLVFFALLFIEKKDFVFILAKGQIKKEEFKFGYTLTYFVASQFFNLGLRMDLFLLSFFMLRNDVGYYGLAQKIILSIITTVISITQVLSPGFSKIKTKSDVMHHMKTGFLYLLLPSGLFLVLFLTPNWIFSLVFTDKFVRTAAIARALSLPFIIYSLGSLPMLFLLYTIKKPVYILVSNVIFFLILTAGCYYLIPRIGVRGPPWAILAAFIVAVAIQVIVMVKEFRKLPA